MIIDSLINAEKYYAIHPKFQRAFEYLKTADIDSLKPGEVQIDVGLKAIVMQNQGMSRQESAANFECHQQHIDIQYCIDGPEEIGWKPKETCSDPKADFNSEKDVQFFYDTPDMYFSLDNQQFAIFFPEDVHAPMISDQVVRKIVVKVSI